MSRTCPVLCTILFTLLAGGVVAIEIDCIDPFESSFREGAFVAADEVAGVAVDDGLALCARATELAILDVTDPDQPQLLATWPLPAGAVSRVALDLPWAAVLRDDGILHVLDLGDPSAPVALPTGEALPTPAVALAMAGDRIALIADAATVCLLEIVPGAAPEAVWIHALAGEASGLALTADHAYVSGDEFGLATLDAAGDTPEPVHLLEAPFESWWRGLAVFGDRLLAAEDYLVWIDMGQGYVSDSVRRLRSLSLADPSAPALDAPIIWPGAGELQLGVAGEHGLVWDGSSLAAVAAPATLPSAIHGLLARDQDVIDLDGATGVAVLATAAGFRCYQVATPANPAPRDWYQNPLVVGAASDFAAGAHHVVHGYRYHFGAGAYQGWEHGLTAHDLLDDTVIGVYFALTFGDAIPLPEPLAVAAGTGPGDERVYYRLGDDEILVSPIVEWAPQTPLPVSGLFAASSGWAFVARGDTLHRINCWDTEAPYVASIHALPAVPTAIHSPFGSVVMLGYEDGLVEIYGFAGGGVEVDPFQAAGAVRSLATSGPLAVIGTDADLQACHAFAIGIPDKDLDDEVWHLVDTAYPVRELVGDGVFAAISSLGYVYAGQGDRGLRIVHATDDTTVDLGYGGPPVTGLHSARSGGNRFVLLAEQPNLAALLTAHCQGTGAPDDVPAAAAASLAVVPNPFNPRTTVSFTLDRPQRARLDLYDLRGRRVRTLAAGEFAAGVHTLAWDGRDAAGADCASGVYLARLQSGMGVARAKLALVR